MLTGGLGAVQDTDDPAASAATQQVAIIHIAAAGRLTLESIPDFSAHWATPMTFS
jgi:hypothetical protein